MQSPAPELLGDLIGASCPGHPGLNGVLLIAPSKQRIRLATAQRRKWERIMRHVAAAYRLRERLASRNDEPAAVLDEAGRVQHAEASAHGDLSTLTDCVRAMERARGRLRRSSPEEALSSWRALVAGKWTVVDWVDTDDRRYLVAHANHVSARSLGQLSARERDVAEFLVTGRTQGEIAYALGLSTGTVNRLARTVLQKFGGARRADLAALFGSVPPMMANVLDEVVALAPSPREELWTRLSSAEHEVVGFALRGLSDARIAKHRNVSVKTVSNQLAKVYARFGVSGRTELAALLGHRV